jgi:hypothetical protein
VEVIVGKGVKVGRMFGAGIGCSEVDRSSGQELRAGEDMGTLKA